MFRTKFYPVITESIWRKHVSREALGVDIHFTELVDEQPAGWLNSLEHYRDDLPPDKINIIDNGAWSYRDEEVSPINAENLAETYREKAPHDSIVIAPDHMLIPGVNIAYRRKWNKEQAVKFLELCPDYLRPMAAVHGETTEERVEYAQWLTHIGYKYLAVGGVAGRAFEFNDICNMVKQVKAAIPSDTWLHVLGLTSLKYLKEWNQIGVTSVDGTSYWRHAFAGKIAYLQDGELMYYDSGRIKEDPDDFLIHVPSVSRAPECNCKACATLREHGIDTRMTGKTLNSQGNALHNLNIIMKAQKLLPPMK